MTKKTLILSLIIVVLAITGTALAYFGLRPEPGQNTSQPASPEATQGGPMDSQNTNTNVILNPDQSRDEESGEIDTSDWKTYRNEEYGFSFRYPGEEWVVNTSVAPSLDQNYKQLFRIFSYERSLGINLDIGPIKSLDRIEDEYYDLLQTDPNLIDSEIYYSKINGVDSIFKKNKHTGNIYIYMNDNKFTYVFSYSAKTIDPNSYQYKIFENIYQSFKFID